MKNKAREFAIERHGDQLYGNQPYAVHLDAVAKIAIDYGEKAAAVAYLHDVVEDTETTLDQIENRFGRLISECVHILTDEPGENRKERKTKTYQKMAAVNGELELALIVKTADRLANLRACVADNNQSLLSMYKSEHPVFRKSAYRTNICEPLWLELDSIVNT